MSDFLRSAGLLFVLLNPFLVIVYLTDVVQKLTFKSFSLVMFRATLMSIPVFWCFCILGDQIFSDIVQADFASFQIFGGIIFLMIGIKFVFHGNAAIEMLRGESEYLAGAIAMPLLIGPGTISASVIIGKRLEPFQGCLAIFLAVVVSVITLCLLKRLHDFVKPRNEALIKRYIEVAGRITALFVGTISIEMIMQGIKTWLQEF